MLKCLNSSLRNRIRIWCLVDPGSEIMYKRPGSATLQTLYLSSYLFNKKLCGRPHVPLISTCLKSVISLTCSIVPSLMCSICSFSPFLGHKRNQIQDTGSFQSLPAILALLPYVFFFVLLAILPVVVMNRFFCTTPLSLISLKWKSGTLLLNSSDIYFVKLCYRVVCNRYASFLLLNLLLYLHYHSQ
jgi:hypothetical protein